MFLGSYPITPASDILHELSKHKNFGVRTMQAEDEIAGVGAALGAAFGGHLGVTTTSGPGVDLKSETIGLAVSLELPLIIIDIQRGGPSTGLPTKTEQADLMLAMYGRHGECAAADRRGQDARRTASTPRSRRCRIALKYRTPVILLSDGYLANGAEPWKLPDVDDAARHHGRRSPPSRTNPDGAVLALPARPGHAGPAVGHPRHARPRAPHRRPREGRRHRQHLLRPRQPRAHDAARARRRSPASRTTSRASRSTTTRTPTLLVLGWGSTYGSIGAAVRRIRARGHKVAHAHLVHLNPFPPNLGDVLRRYREGAGARDEPRPARRADPRRVPRRRQVVHQGAGPAVQGRRDRAAPSWRLLAS